MAKHDAGDNGGTDDGDAGLAEGVGEFFDTAIGGGAAAGEDDDEDDEEDGAGTGGAGGNDDDDEEDDLGEREDDDDDEDDLGERAGEDDDDDEDDLAGDLDPDVAAAAAEHQIPTQFADVLKKIPDKKVRAEVRTLFAARLKDVDKGLQRAFQQARKERPILAKLQAEKEYLDANTIDFILEQMEKDPKLADRLNAELEKMETAAYAEAKKMRRDDAKKTLENKAKELEQQSDREEKERTRRQERAEHVTTLAKKLSTQEGVPFRLVSNALYIAITTSATGDVTDAEVRKIVAQEAKVLRKHTGESKREARKTYIKTKTDDVKSAQRRVSGRDRGHPPAPTRVREPKSLHEALSRAAGRIIPDAPA